MGFQEIARDSAVKCQIVRAEDPADAEGPPLAKHKIGGSVVVGSGPETETQFPPALLAMGRSTPGTTFGTTLFLHT